MESPSDKNIFVCSLLCHERVPEKRMKSSQLRKLSQSAGGTREKLQKLSWNIPL